MAALMRRSVSSFPWRKNNDRKPSASQQQETEQVEQQEEERGGKVAAEEEEVVSPFSPPPPPPPAARAPLPPPPGREDVDFEKQRQKAERLRRWMRGLGEREEEGEELGVSSPILSSSNRRLSRTFTPERPGSRHFRESRGDGIRERGGEKRGERGMGRRRRGREREEGGRHSYDSGLTYWRGGERDDHEGLRQSYDVGQIARARGEREGERDFGGRHSYDGVQPQVPFFYPETPPRREKERDRTRREDPSLSPAYLSPPQSTLPQKYVSPPASSLSPPVASSHPYIGSREERRRSADKMGGEREGERNVSSLSPAAFSSAARSPPVPHQREQQAGESQEGQDRREETRAAQQREESTLSSSFSAWNTAGPTVEREEERSERVQKEKEEESHILGQPLPSAHYPPQSLSSPSRQDPHHPQPLRGMSRDRGEWERRTLSPLSSPDPSSKTWEAGERQREREREREREARNNRGSEGGGWHLSYSHGEALLTPPQFAYAAPPPPPPPPFSLPVHLGPSFSPPAHPSPSPLPPHVSLLPCSPQYSSSFYSSELHEPPEGTTFTVTWSRGTTGFFLKMQDGWPIIGSLKSTFGPDACPDFYGKVTPGDVLVAANDIGTSYVGIEAVIELLTSQPFPITLTFVRPTMVERNVAGRVARINSVSTSSVTSIELPPPPNASRSSSTGGSSSLLTSSLPVNKDHSRRRRRASGEELEKKVDCLSVGQLQPRANPSVPTIEQEQEKEREDDGSASERRERKSFQVQEAVVLEEQHKKGGEDGNEEDPTSWETQELTKDYAAEREVLRTPSPEERDKNSSIASSYTFSPYYPHKLQRQEEGTIEEQGSREGTKSPGKNTAVLSPLRQLKASSKEQEREAHPPHPSVFTVVPGRDSPVRSPPSHSSLSSGAALPSLSYDPRRELLPVVTPLVAGDSSSPRPSSTSFPSASSLATFDSHPDIGRKSHGGGEAGRRTLTLSAPPLPYEEERQAQIAAQQMLLVNEQPCEQRGERRDVLGEQAGQQEEEEKRPSVYHVLWCDRYKLAISLKQDFVTSRVYISKILPDLFPGVHRGKDLARLNDTLLSVNNIEVQGLELAEVVSLIATSERPVVLLFSSSPSSPAFLSSSSRSPSFASARSSPAM